MQSSVEQEMGGAVERREPVLKRLLHLSQLHPQLIRLDSAGAPMMLSPMRSACQPSVRCACIFVWLSVMAASCHSAPHAEAETPVNLGAGLVVDRRAGEVRLSCEVACDRGWLEQAVCRAGTREHESLLAVNVPPSRIHAALLLLGLVPGAPGQWRAAVDGVSNPTRVPPSGASLQLLVRFNGRDVPLSSWIHDPVHQQAFPSEPWVFSGSRMRANTPSMGPGEHYVADLTGSVVGIVTFGDETIAFTDVLSDKAELDAPQWQANTALMPSAGTAVELVIRGAPTESAGKK